MKVTRTHLAWLIWCFCEGYGNAGDRAVLTNWVEGDPTKLTNEDVATRDHLLAMADEVLAILRERVAVIPWTVIEKLREHDLGIDPFVDAVIDAADEAP